LNPPVGLKFSNRAADRVLWTSRVLDYLLRAGAFVVRDGNEYSGLVAKQAVTTFDIRIERGGVPIADD
jgi:hypothetical protein